MTSMRLPALLTIAYLNGIGLYLAHEAATVQAPQTVAAGAHSCRAPQLVVHAPAAPNRVSA